MRIFIPFIMNMTLCVVYSLCIEQINIYKPIAHMNISTGILFRLSIMVMFLTLLIGMLVVRFTKRKYLMVLPIIMPILLWSTCINIFPYRSFVYMGISALIYLTYIVILWYCDKKGSMKTTTIILLLTSLFTASCGEQLMPPPDEKMIQHFNTHEAAFHKIHRLIEDGTEGSYHYPPYRPDTANSFSLQIFEEIHGIPYKPFKLYGEDTLYLQGLSPSIQMQLDFLLGLTSCKLLRFNRRKQDVTDSVRLNLTLVYYSHGIVDAGTSKSFVYDPELRSRRNIRITEQGDLNEIYRRAYNDTMLYKPIKGNWYIELDHSR